jgi:hypothetical protein
MIRQRDNASAAPARAVWHRRRMDRTHRTTSLRNVIPSSIQSIRFAGWRKEGTVTGRKSNLGCLATSFPINATLRCRSLGLRWSDLSRTAAMNLSTAGSSMSGARSHSRNHLCCPLYRLNQRRVVAVGLRAVYPLRNRPPLQVVILNRLQLLDAHVTAEPMVELLGLQQDRHPIVDLADEFIRIARWRSD